MARGQAARTRPTWPAHRAGTTGVDDRSRIAVRRPGQAAPRVQAAAPEPAARRHAVPPDQGATRRRTSPPRTFIFGGKAAPGYRMAKLIIKLINSRGRGGQHRSRRWRDRLKVVFLPDFNVEARRSMIYPRGRPLRADLDGRQGSLRHRQHEVRAQRRAHHRHAGRRQHRDPRGGRGGELLPLRPDRRGGRRPCARAATTRTRTTRQRRRARARPSTRSPPASSPWTGDTVQPLVNRCCAGTSTCSWPTTGPTSTARTGPPGQAWADQDRWTQMSIREHCPLRLLLLRPDGPRLLPRHLARPSGPSAAGPGGRPGRPGAGP